MCTSNTRMSAYVPTLILKPHVCVFGLCLAHNPLSQYIIYPQLINIYYQRQMPYQDNNFSDGLRDKKRKK